jgi:hypothetical protein
MMLSYWPFEEPVLGAGPLLSHLECGPVFYSAAFCNTACKRRSSCSAALLTSALLNCPKTLAGRSYSKATTPFFAATQGPGESGQCRERRGLEGQQLVVAGLLHLARPGRIDEQRATDRDQIELVALQPVEQVVDPGGRGRFAS